MHEVVENQIAIKLELLFSTTVPSQPTGINLMHGHTYMWGAGSLYYPNSAQGQTGFSIFTVQQRKIILY